MCFFLYHIEAHLITLTDLTTLDRPPPFTHSPRQYNLHNEWSGQIIIYITEREPGFHPPGSLNGVIVCNWFVRAEGNTNRIIQLGKPLCMWRMLRALMSFSSLLAQPPVRPCASGVAIGVASACSG